MEDKKITAKEARQISDTTNCLLNRIYKAIREESKEGRVQLCWDVFHTSEVLVNTCVNQLKEDGYVIKKSYNGTTHLTDITISW